MASRKRSNLGRIGLVLRWSGLLVLALIVGAAAILFTTDFNAYRTTIAERAEAATGRKVSIGGDLTLAFSLQPTLEVEDVAVANAPWGTRPQMFEAERLEAKLELLPLLSGDVAIERIALVAPTVYLETDSQGGGNWVFAQADAKPDTAASDSPPLSVSVRDMTVTDALIAFRDGEADKLTEVKVDRIRLSMDAADQPLNLTVEGRYLDEAFSVDGTVGSLAALQTGGAPVPVDIDVAYAEVEASVAGRVALTGTGKSDLKITAQAESLDDLGETFGIDLSKVGGLNLEASLAGAPDALTLEIEALELGDSDLRGNVVINLGQMPPAVAADLSAEQLHLDPFLAVAEAHGAHAGTDASETADDGKLLSDRPIPAFALLDRFNGTFNLRAGLVDVRGHQFRNLDAAATLRGGAFTLDLKRLSFHDGEIGGQLAVRDNAAVPTVTFRAEVSGFDVASLQEAMGGDALLESRLKGAIDLRATGNSLHALAAGSDGVVRLALGEGRINSRYAELIAADLIQALLPGGNDFARLNCAVARFDIADGVATLSDFLIDSERMAVGGEGSADLGAETLDLKVLPRPKNPSLISLSPPVNVGGTFLAPSFAPDTAAVVTGIAGAVVGTAINPLGILVPFVSAGTGGADACTAALEAARTGKPVETPETGGLKSAPGKVIEGVGEGLKDVGEGVTRGLRGLFGR